MNQRQLGDHDLLLLGRLELEQEPELELKHPVRDPRGLPEAPLERSPARLLVRPREWVQVQRDLEVPVQGLSRQVK